MDGSRLELNATQLSVGDLRYVDMVYSVALREVRDSHLAEDVSQAVFLILAQKGELLKADVILSGWLCRMARFAAANALIMERRRPKRACPFECQPS